MLAQQNMTEEMLYKMPSFQQRMKELDVAFIKPLIIVGIIGIYCKKIVKK